MTSTEKTGGNRQIISWGFKAGMIFFKGRLPLGPYEVGAALKGGGNLLDELVRFVVDCSVVREMASQAALPCRRRLEAGGLRKD